MKLFTFALSLLMLSSVCAQQRASSPERYVRIPTANILVVTASQPNSPLKIEEAMFLRGVDSTKTMTVYKVRNVSQKPITFFIVDAWNSEGAGGTLTVWNSNARKRSPLLPNESLQISKAEAGFELVPLTDEIRKELESEGVKFAQILLIREVVFADGSVFNDKETAEVASELVQKWSR